MLFHRHRNSKKEDQFPADVDRVISPMDPGSTEKKESRYFEKSIILIRRRQRFLLWLFFSLSIVFSLRGIFWHPSFDPILTTWNSFPSTGVNHACDGYNGIYHIEKGDIGGAAGTVFFQFVIGQILWAEKYNFKPWIHFNNVSHIVYDPVVHGNASGVDFTMQKGMKISYVDRPMGHRKDFVPGPPIGDTKKLKPFQYHFSGDGIWNNYFEPISDFIPGDESCKNKPLVTMDLYLVTPGVHGFSGAPRCWRYDYLPDYITKPHMPLKDWLAPQRQSAHDVLKRYIRFLPHIEEKAEKVNPYCSIENSCLGMHIRHSDKAAGRRVIGTDEFLPYAKAFLNAGGKWIYLATDSEKVVEHIKRSWPENVLRVIRSMGDDVIRSSDLQAVFDIGSHHRTNTEILVEILALSKCQFMIHGLSAVTESSIWININLHYTSINLEDPEHPNEDEFQNTVAMVLNDGNVKQVAQTQETSDWWDPSSASLVLTPKDIEPCNSYDGILHISHVDENDGTGAAFFTSILNQFIYADENNLKPWIYLNHDSKLIYDPEVHGKEVVVLKNILDTLRISPSRNDRNASLEYPGPLVKNTRYFSSNPKKEIMIQGNGIWTSYFRPVTNFIPNDNDCKQHPIVSLDQSMVTKLNSFSPSSSRAWQYNDIPNDLWNPNGLTLKAWLEPMRLKANAIAKKYIDFQPYIVERANQVNPIDANSPPCLAVHFRNADKAGIHRQKFPPNKFREYFVAFAEAGGKDIYVASDSHNSLKYLMEHFPPDIRSMIRSQGPYVVRSSWKWPPHMLENHHRVNAEALVDVVAMSKCQFLLHGNSAISEAAIYLNINLHNQSVNWEDEDRLSPLQFHSMVSEVMKAQEVHPETTETRVAVPEESVTIIRGDPNQVACKRNAIVYLAQKNHSSYNRNSFEFLLESLKLLDKNFLSLNDHQNNTDVLIFHTDDFSGDDLDLIEEKLGRDLRKAIHFVDLHNTSYWRRPSWHSNDNPAVDWYAYPLFSEGYRQMMHWYAIDIWRFFDDHGKRNGCSYEYIMRLDEDSFVRSPIQYDIFEFMKKNDYNYGFRLCAYELQVTRRMWKIWRRMKGSPEPERDIDFDMCGVYNNFFVAKLSFFQSPKVQRFLKVVDRNGMIYRRRLGDLMIHSMAVYGFSPASQIHRFLDFTYQHSTFDLSTGCVVWGGIQAGYNDPNANATLEDYWKKNVAGKNGCTANTTVMSSADLSPTYNHLPANLVEEIGLKTIMAGKVELPDQGVLSG